MDYKEKLRLAKEALNSGSYDRETIEYIFPELKELEDERIRKGIIKFLIDVNNGAYTKSELEIASWIAWLEKQGESKLAESEDESIRKAQLDYWRSVGGKEWHGVPVQEAIAWLEKQKTVEWSEEDEIGSDATIELLEYFINYAPEFRRPTIRRSIDWLKSLKKRLEEQK